MLLLIYLVLLSMLIKTTVTKTIYYYITVRTTDEGIV
jgi:hypothetical protein